MKLSHLSLILALLPLGALDAAADTLLIDDAARRSADVERPDRGMSMQRVRQRFGEPIKRVAPVGEPPISRWVYDRYTVYFERDLVITSVVKR